MQRSGNITSEPMANFSGLPAKFPALLTQYYSRISEAIRRNSHHDHRRALLMDFLRESFGIEIDEVELELKIKAVEARGRIDAFYKFVIFEVKTDIEQERLDAIRELKKYFESRRNPVDYVAVVTDGVKFEVYDYDATSKEPAELRRFEIKPNQPLPVYRELDELLAAGQKVAPTSDDIVGRFGLKSMSFHRSVQQLQRTYRLVAADSAVTVKFREWNSLLAKVYGTVVGDNSLFLRHTYLSILARAIVTMALFPKHMRGDSLYRDLLTGKFFRDQSILNLAEPDFFSWSLETAGEAPFFQVLDSIFIAGRYGVQPTKYWTKNDAPSTVAKACSGEVNRHECNPEIEQQLASKTSKVRCETGRNYRACGTRLRPGGRRFSLGKRRKCPAAGVHGHHCERIGSGRNSGGRPYFRVR
jgi:hypothetical protein